MTAGLQQGTKALKFMELADMISLRSRFLDSSMETPVAQVQEECHQTIEAQYRCLEGQIGDCKEQIADISRRLAATSAASRLATTHKDTATSFAVTPSGEVCEICEGIGEAAGRAMSAIGSMLWPLDNLLKLIQPAVIDVMYVFQQCTSPATS